MDILGTQAHPVVQLLFPNNDANFSRWFAHTHCQKCSVFVWGPWREHEDVLQHLLWLPQLPTLNFMEPLWSVLESRVRNRLPPSSLKQLEEEWYSIPLETIQNLHESIPRRIQAVLQQMVAQLHI